MKPAFLAPPGTLAKKPPHGAPCNRCGLCCVATLCPLGRFLFGRETGPCPALQMNDGGSACGLVADPGRFAGGRTMVEGRARMSEAALQLIGAATGCDARFNGEPADEAFYAELRENDRRTRAQTSRARKTWGIK